MKKVAIFDIDGTIFRSSLLVELTDAFIQEGIFSSKVGKSYARSHKAWLDRKGSYEKYIIEVIDAFHENIKGVKYAEFLKTAKKVVAFHKNRIYRYTRDLVRDLKKKGYYLLAISKSPKEIVGEFGKQLGFDKVYGLVYEIDDRKRLTGEILFWDLISDKAKILKRAIKKDNLTLKGSVGVGDTESDIAFLKMVEKPICFNPNKKLFQYAKRAGWKIIVERKDVVYNF
jgi:HAD superfamily hydrolase (TIGR01490 family)